MRDFQPQKSVDWYDPIQLAKTGLRVVISSIFGDFVDRRELQEVMNSADSDELFQDYSNQESIWVDYLSDTGDGFDATYTMATLLAKPMLKNSETVTQRGKLLIMGGDQVYPVATREEYHNRMKGPYNSAFSYNDEDKDPPHVFAIPGNHDWYDGLTSFLKVFGQKRSLGNWRTQQSRSYFALKLPHDVWLLGIDVQLNSDIDYNQLNYFKCIAQKHFTAASKVILCTAEPSWVYHTSKNGHAYNNLRFFEEEIGKWGNARQVLTLSGDLHHYARYELASGAQKITAGGGGAFLHPTQNLPKKISGLREGTAGLKSVFPSFKDSRKLLLRNVGFGFTSIRMSVLFGLVYMFFGAFSHLTAKPGNSSIMAIEELMFHVIRNPGSMLMILLLIGGLVGFVNRNPYNPRFSSNFLYNLFGFLHGVVQAVVMVGIFWFVTNWLVGFQFSDMISWLALEFVLFCSGALLGGFVFGMYLIKSNLLLGNHDNEAYSSLRWSGYKCFVRMQVAKSGITIYPYGLKKVQKWKEEIKDGKQCFVSSDQLSYELIEQPVVISFNGSKNEDE